MNDRTRCLNLILEIRELLVPEVMDEWNVKNVKQIMLRSYGNWFRPKISDAEYADNLLRIKENTIKLFWKYDPQDELDLYKVICSKLYVARNITADVSTIHDCLSDLDKLYNGDNDHNGEASDIDIIKQVFWVQKKLFDKYARFCV
jgi:hypothetical protein